MSSGTSFWKELRERRVARVGLVYLVVAWAIFEGSDTLRSVLALPEFTPRLVFALAALGFPIALVLAWAFQVTPDGVKRAERYSTSGRINAPFTAGVAVGVVAVSAVAFVLLGNREQDVDSDGAEPVDRNAVAVLPSARTCPRSCRTSGAGSWTSWPPVSTERSVRARSIPAPWSESPVATVTTPSPSRVP